MRESRHAGRYGYTLFKFFAKFERIRRNDANYYPSNCQILVRAQMYHQSMDLVFDIATSLEFWRRIYPADRKPHGPNNPAFNDVAKSQHEIDELLPNWVTPEFLEPLGGKVHVLSFNSAERRTTSFTQTHIWTAGVPEASFYKLTDSVYVASPEFIFLGASSLLGIHKLIALGDELCGFYSFDKRQPRGFRKRIVPLTSMQDIAVYLDRAPGCLGIQQARLAISHVVDCSASPMESFDEMALCLPFRLGGYGVCRPLMNFPIKLSKKAAHVAGQDKCYGDMCWPHEYLDIEHQGEMDHGQGQRAIADRARINAIKEMGYEVIELTAQQVYDSESFEVLVLQAARKLKRRIRKKYLGETDARTEMREAIRSWNGSYGRIR